MCKENELYTKVKNHIEIISGSGDKLISTKCDDINEILEIQCSKGHRKYEATYYEYVEGLRCKRCRNGETYPRYKYSDKKKIIYVESRGFKVENLNFFIKGVGEKMELICPMGKKVYIGFTDFRRNGRRCAGTCRKCGKSSGEIAITIYLDKKNIKYCIWEKIPLSDKKKVEVDFVIYDKNGKSRFMIEFNGIEHYREIRHFGGKEGLLKIQVRDKLKEKYCDENEITLIRIPYWDSSDIDEILDKRIDLKLF